MTAAQSLNADQAAQMRTKALAAGAIDAALVSLSRPLSLDIYRDWLRSEAHGSMTYLERHLPIKENPQSRWPQMRSALVLLVPYPTEPDDSEEKPLKQLRRARYSLGPDYHEHFVLQFQAYLSELKNLYPSEAFLLLTDSAPVMERDLAHRAGLGWFGKNSCLLNRQHGSLFLIAEIFTSLQAPAELTLQVSPDFCGTCRRCIDACPTAAILENRTIQATKCISYWTIESKELPPESLRPQFNDWFFGCDLCQTVCPWNAKVFGKAQMEKESQKFQGADAEVQQELFWLLEASDQELKNAFANSPLLRAKPRGLRRNALTVTANRKLKSLKPQVEKYLSDPDLKELAHWVLKQL